MYYRTLETGEVIQMRRRPMPEADTPEYDDEILRRGLIGAYIGVLCELRQHPIPWHLEGSHEARLQVRRELGFADRSPGESEEHLAEIRSALVNRWGIDPETIDIDEPDYFEPIE